MPKDTTSKECYVPILRWGEHDISLKIVHQAGYESAWQTATLAKLNAPTNASRPSPMIIFTKFIFIFMRNIHFYFYMIALDGVRTCVFCLVSEHAYHKPDMIALDGVRICVFCLVSEHHSSRHCRPMLVVIITRSPLL